ncbi:MAG: RNA polymerase sigma factor [Candidatus Hydrogenedentes bacterium]|nr:RNA polymerase sigma factor [Candidatus Hydrogenedentota bacterium]
MKDESKLVRQAAGGDAGALGELFRRYGADVLRLARSMGHRGGEAEDLMQDTFLAAMEGIGRFQHRSSFKTWLLAILFRQSSRRYRYQAVRAEESLGHAPDGAGNGGPRLSVVPRPEYRLDVEAMLDSLSPDHRAVLVLRELEGYSYDEIASALGIPRGTVESRLFRARAQLREGFKEYSTRDARHARARRNPVETGHD